MKKLKFTITIIGENAINKLESLGRKKGEYVSALIDKDIKFEQLEKRVKELEEGNK